MVARLPLEFKAVTNLLELCDSDLSGAVYFPSHFDLTALVNSLKIQSSGSNEDVFNGFPSVLFRIGGNVVCF
jgi:hypothetical protein